MDSPTRKEKSDYDTPASVVAVDSIREGSVHAGEVEVFAAGEDGVNFRRTGWITAAMFMLKIIFAAGVLSIPQALYVLGAVAGAIFIVFWGCVNTYMGYVQVTFKLLHPSVHSVTDSAYIVALQWSHGNKRVSAIVREIVEIFYIIAWIICAGISILGLSIAFNAVSTNATCSVTFGFVAYFITATVASIRKIERLGWVAWTGFISIVSAVMIVVIAVTIPDRPAAAPKTGPYDLGFSAWPPAGTAFPAAWAAALAIFASSANTSGFVPVISEMRNPKDGFKSIFACMTWVHTSYVAIGLTVFAYCGKWVASPALGSAGPTIKIVSYGVAIPGLIAGAMVCIHISAKSLFVRILRGTTHLTSNSKTHWIVWLSCTYGTGLLGWILSEAIPFFGSLVSLIGAVGFSPLGVCLPTILWFSMHPGAMKGPLKMKAAWLLHICLFVLGLFMCFAGTYVNIKNIIDQYKAGQVSAPFTCADNSGTVG